MKNTFCFRTILVAPHFYWSSCSVCYKCSSPMKRCTRCPSIWKKLKSLCNYLAKLEKMEGSLWSRVSELVELLYLLR